MNQFGRFKPQNAHNEIQGGYLDHVLGFEVTEGIQETEAVLEAENLTLAFMNQFGRFKPQNAHNEI